MKRKTADPPQEGAGRRSFGAWKRAELLPEHEHLVATADGGQDVAVDGRLLESFTVVIEGHGVGVGVSAPAVAGPPPTLSLCDDHTTRAHRHGISRDAATARGPVVESSPTALLTPRTHDERDPPGS